jgi:hypothetical protein
MSTLAPVLKAALVLWTWLSVLVRDTHTWQAAGDLTVQILLVFLGAVLCSAPIFLVYRIASFGLS